MVHRVPDLLDDRRATKAAIVKRLEQGPASVADIAAAIEQDDLLQVILCCDDLLERGKLRIHRGRRRRPERDPRDLMGELSLQSFRDDPDYAIRRLAPDGLDRDDLVQAIHAIWAACVLEKCIRPKTAKRRDNREGRFLAPIRGNMPGRRF